MSAFVAGCHSRKSVLCFRLVKRGVKATSSSQGEVCSTSILLRGMMANHTLTWTSLVNFTPGISVASLANF